MVSYILTFTNDGNENQLQNHLITNLLLVSFKFLELLNENLKVYPLSVKNNYIISIKTKS